MNIKSEVALIDRKRKRARRREREGRAQLVQYLHVVTDIELLKTCRCGQHYEMPEEFVIINHY